MHLTLIISNIGCLLSASHRHWLLFFFLVDVSPPTVVVAPYFTSPRDGKRTDSQWDRSVLQLIWQFADPDSPVVSHTVNVRSQLTGRLLTEPIVVGADDKVRCYADDNTPHL